MQQQAPAAAFLLACLTHTPLGTATCSKSHHGCSCIPSPGCSKGSTTAPRAPGQGPAVPEASLVSPLPSASGEFDQTPEHLYGHTVLQPQPGKLPPVSPAEVPQKAIINLLTQFNTPFLSEKNSSGLGGAGYSRRFRVFLNQNNFCTEHFRYIFFLSFHSSSTTLKLACYTGI